MDSLKKIFAKSVLNYPKRIKTYLLPLPLSAFLAYSVDLMAPLEVEGVDQKEQVLQSYETALRTLSEAKDEYVNRETVFSDEKAKYQSLMDRFVTEIHIDNNIDERNAKKLLTNFEMEHGSIEDVTSFSQPLDYNELHEARAYVNGRNEILDTKEKALWVNRQAGAINRPGIAWSTLALGYILPLICLGYSSTRRTKLESWAKGKKREFNH